MKYCQKCGEQLFDETAYCPSCGKEQQFIIKKDANSLPVTKVSDTDNSGEYANMEYSSKSADEKIKTMGFGNAIKSVFSNYCTFNGRARRAEFWYFYLFTMLVNALYLIFSFATENNLAVSIVYIVYSLVVFLPSLGVTVRRFHDIGRSGWAIFVTLIPIVGFIIYLVWTCTDSQPGENMYGPNPKGGK